VQPQSVSVSYGTSVSFAVVATNATGYQWRRNGVAIAGATNATYNISSVAKTDLGTYTVIVSNSDGVVTSSDAVLTAFQTSPIVITTQPVGSKVKAASSFTFSVVATNVDDYQWYKGGIAIAGATDAAYVISKIAASDFGDYYVKLSNHSGTVNSVTVSLVDVVPRIPPSVLLPATALGFAKGESITIPVYSNSTVENWKCTALPDGLDFDKELGRISGTATTTGVWVIAVTALNTYGTDTKNLVLEIAEAEQSAATGFNLVVDVETKAVQVPGQTQTTGVTPVIGIKGRDDVVLFVQFQKAGVALDLQLSSLVLVLKEDVESIPLVVSSDFAKQSDAAGDFYVLRFKADSAVIDALFTNHEGPVRTEFQALAELSWRVVSTWSNVGPRTYAHSSRIFPISVIRDLGQL
jgi:hypothetical protein